jgi:hypothetical protein
LNSTAIPEKVELNFVSFETLHISWNRLTYAKVRGVNLKDLAQLFQHASQMTDCHISLFAYAPESFSMPPIIHHRLKKLSLHESDDRGVAAVLLGLLTLPGLQEIETDFPTLLPALMHRSSCPLTRLTLSKRFEAGPFGSQPFPGVTDLVVENQSPQKRSRAVLIGNFLLEEYFPDLRRLTLRPPTFLLLLDMGTFPLLVDYRRLRSGGREEGKLKIFVVDEDDASLIEDTDVGERLKALGISPMQREDGIEFLV